MDLSGISKRQLYLLATNNFDRRSFEMIFSAKTYNETGALYARMRNDGLLLVEGGKWRLNDEVKVFAQPIVNEVESIASELIPVLQRFVDTYEPDTELKASATSAFWWGRHSNFYRFNITDHGDDLIVKVRFSSELEVQDGEASTSQVLLFKPPLSPQFDYILASLRAHVEWVEKMSAIGRRLKG